MMLRSGQAMIIAVLSLGGVILGATTIAGFLMLYTIRATSDSTNSAKAIFAADAGVNWALYSYFNPPEQASTTFSNGATVAVVCSDTTGNAVSCGDSGAVSAISKGIAVNSSRAFLLNITTATTTVP